MKSPLTFAWSNVLFGAGPDDAWGVYRLATESYAGLTTQAKRDVLGGLASLAFSRGVCEPVLDPFWHPQAVVVEAADAEGGVRFVPLKADVLRLCDSVIEVEARSLKVSSGERESDQAFLTLGALPEVVSFPG